MNDDTILGRDLTAAHPVGTDELAGLRDRLVVDAESAGVLDIGFDVVDTPVGRLLVAATAVGLVRLAFAVEDHDEVLQQLSDRVGPRVMRAPSRVAAVARQLDEYFAGTRREFDLAIDWQLSAGFRSAVLHRLPDIGYGRTASYTAVATLAGSPKAVRAVGTACATNPIPVVVPCHRVVRADGSMGGYLGGAEAKRHLLDLESAA